MIRRVACPRCDGAGSFPTISGVDYARCPYCEGRGLIAAGGLDDAHEQFAYAAMRSEQTRRGGGHGPGRRRSRRALDLG